MKCTSERKSMKQTAAVRRMICRRILSMVMVLALLLTDSSFPLLTVTAKTVTSNKLDEWTVQAAWSTMSADYHWEAKEDTFRQPKLVITYRTSAAEREYKPGELRITVPGIGNVNRTGTIKASQVAAAASEADKEKYDWSYTYDEKQDLYTFVNNFTVTKDQQFSGGFELLWDLQSRRSINGYSQSEYPKFAVNGGEITLPALNFSYTSERDTYNLQMEAKTLGGNDWLGSDQEYVWYDIRSYFGFTKKARGLYNYEYFVGLDLPAGINGENIRVEGREVVQVDGRWGFYIYKDEYRETTDSYKDFRIGFPASEVDALMKEPDESRKVTVSGHLDRVYQDDEGWTRTSIGEGDNVDARVELILTHYRYRTEYHGYDYSVSKSVDRYSSSYPYNSRMNVAELYGGTTRIFDISGYANRSYTVVTEQPEEAALDDGPEEESVENVLTEKAVQAVPEEKEPQTDAVTEKTETVPPVPEEDSVKADDPQEEKPGITDTEENPEGTDSEEKTPDTEKKEENKEANQIEEPAPEEDSVNAEPAEDVKTEESETVPDETVPEESAPEGSALEKTVPEESVSEETKDEQEPSRAYADVDKEWKTQTMTETVEPPAEGEDAPGTAEPSAEEEDARKDAEPPAEEADTPEDFSENAEPAAAPLKAKALRTAPSSGTLAGIEDGKNYSMRLYDREISVMQNNGEMRPLTADEYDISYVTVKAGSVSGLAYTLYSSEDVNATSDDQYKRLYTGTTGSSQTFQMPANCHSIYLSIDRGQKLNGDFRWGASLGVHVQTDWEAEQAKSYDERLNAEGYLQNTSVMQIYGYVQDQAGEVTYEAVPLIEEDTQPDEAYMEDLALHTEEEEILLAREVQASARVYLREAVTDVSARTGVNEFEQDATFQNFSTTVTSSGKIQADDSGNLSRFSLYTILPRGMSVDSGKEIAVTGTFWDIYGREIGADEYKSRVSYSVRKLGEDTLLTADFDFSDRPLELSRETAVSVVYPVYVPYNAYLEYGEPRYTEQTWLLLHDEGLTKLTNSMNTNDGLRYDTLDLDGDGITFEWAAYSSGYADAKEWAKDWREEAVKYVKSNFTDQLYEESPAESPSYIERYPGTENPDSLYSYKMEFTLGDAPAKDVVFYDRIETGATVGTGENKNDLESAWQGKALTVDTSYAAGQGFVPTVYYTTDIQAEFDYTKDHVWKKASAAGNRWSLPDGARAVAVHLGTDRLSGNGLWEPRIENENSFRTTYVELRMRAPQTEGTDFRIGKQAVNQFTVSYESYEWDAEHNTPAPSEQKNWQSTPTAITLTDILGTAVLQKTDEESGNALAGAEFTIYQRDKTTVLEVNGTRYENVRTNAFGKLELKDIPYGTYYYEETKAPRGYEKLNGKQEFTLDQDTVNVEIQDGRLPGSVILTKTDADDPSVKGLPDVSFELYTTSGERVFATGNTGTYTYASDGAVSTLTTGSDGTLKVEDLPWGGYYFKELEAPQGYILSEEKAAFTVGRNQANGDNTAVEAKVTIGNEEQEAVLRLTKYDADGEKENPAGVKGAVYSLYREKRGDETEDVLVEERLTTNAAGEIRVEGLKFGTYYFKEIMAAPGYVLTEGDEISEKAVLDVETAGKTVDVKHADHRKPGTLVLNKLEAGDAVHYLEGAVYELYTSDGERVYVKKDTKTDEDGGKLYHYSEAPMLSVKLTTAGKYGAFRIEGLPWGTYVLKETEAPKGYVLPEDEISGSFTVNARTAQQEIYLELTNERQAGSARLVKVDAKDSGKKLPGAGYALYTTAGEAVSVYPVPDSETAAYTCKAPKGADAAAGVAEMTTGEDGTFLIRDIPQGGYYLMETKAPDGYSLSDEYLRFSVTTENCMMTQEIVAKDEKGKGVLTITKTVDEVYHGFGNPTFLFRITRQDGDQPGKSYYQSITLTSGKKTGSATVTLEEGSYMVEELKTARYELSNAEGIKGTVTVRSDQKSADVSLTSAVSEAAVSFSNDLKRYDLYSHTSNLTNIVKKEKLLVGISVNYVGPTSDFENQPGYNKVEEKYVFRDEDLEVTAFYDDGTSKKLTLGTAAADGVYVLTPASVEADGINTSVTGTVTYTEGNVTATGYFDLTFEFPEGTKKVTLTLDLNGGTLNLPEGTVENVYRMKVKPNETVTLPGLESLHAGTGREYWTALGWFKDRDGKEKIGESITVDKNMTIYACYEPYYDVKYAVMLCGIGADLWRDADGTESVTGLTFGPAARMGKSYSYDKEKEHGYDSSANYNNTFGSHVPSGTTERNYTLEAGGKSSKIYAGGNEKRCIHNDSWEEIIRWSKTDPRVYEDCITNLCTHSVLLDFKHTAAQYLFENSYMSKQTGDGAGTLYYSIKADYRCWEMNASSGGGWSESRVRAVFNGSDEQTDPAFAGVDVSDIKSNNALLAAFPESLQSNIKPKVVKVLKDGMYTSDIICSYDKLWLLSAGEIVQDQNAMSDMKYYRLESTKGSFYDVYRYPLTGILSLHMVYPRIANEKGGYGDKWTRSIYNQRLADRIYSFTASGFLKRENATESFGLSPCFCLE